MRMPSTVSPERSLLALMPRSANRIVSKMLMRVTAPARRTSCTIRPSTSRISRRACAATSFSWVISTIVRPEPVEPVQHGEHVGSGLGVEVAGRLVGQHQRRRGHQRPGHRDPLLLAAGELVRLVAGPVGQPDHVQRGPRPGPALRPPCSPA